VARKFRITRRTPWWIILLVALFSLVQQLGWLQPAEQKLVEMQPGQYAVIQVLDGDTIEVDMNGAREKVRLIGVDTPETHDPRKQVQCFGRAASEFTKQLINDKPVRLVADPQSSNRDRYQRLLRYVYLPDNTLVQAEIIKQGYGFAYTSFPFDKSEEFRAYQTEARENNHGLWGSCQPTENEYGGYTSSDE
jgi:endonuclease YncB( thermonuclease family)